MRFVSTQKATQGQEGEEIISSERVITACGSRDSQRAAINTSGQRIRGKIKYIVGRRMRRADAEV